MRRDELGGMSGEDPATPLRYALSEEAARARGRAMAAWSAIAVAMPPVLVVVLVTEMHLAEAQLLVPIAALVIALAVVRGIVGYRATVRRLRALAVQVDSDGLAVRTVRGAARIASAEVLRVVEVTGPLGGLRLELREREDLPARVDLPRGGARYAELRAALAAWRPVERTPRRGRVARIGFGVAVVLAMFFLPFFVEDVVARSRVAAFAVVLALWVATRAAIARSS